MKSLAKHWHPLGENKVECELCPHHCKLKEGQFGICGVRKNEGGKLVTFTYGTLISAAVDPIEKK
ncbi:MAG: AmmeMemoRadiSam system radical SAM enzyme, partial [Aquificaceae bacterium]